MVMRPQQRAGRGPAPTVGWDGTDVWGLRGVCGGLVGLVRGRISCGPVAAYSVRDPAMHSAQGGPDEIRPLRSPVTTLPRRHKLSAALSRADSQRGR